MHLLFYSSYAKLKLKDTYGSDRPVITKFQFLPQYSRKFCYKLSLKSHDLDNLYLYLKSNASDVLSFTDASLIARYNKFFSFILESARNFVPVDKKLPHNQVYSRQPDPPL